MSYRSADSSPYHGSRGGDGRSPDHASPASSKKGLEWAPLEKHPLFSSISGDSANISSAVETTPSFSGVRNLLAWDSGSSRLYLWDAKSRCVHRLAVRFRDPDPDPDPDPVSISLTFSSSVVEAASPYETLVMDIKVQDTVHHISLNTNGSTLLLAGSEGLSVMFLYERTCTIGKKVSCRTVLLGSGLFSSYTNGLRVLQASWHPYSSSHLGVLSSDSALRLFDLSSDLEQPEQEFYLQPEIGRNKNNASVCPIAFSFGGLHLWERFSVFILYSNGLLYILCPVVPFGSVCSWTHIKEVYEDAHVYGSKSSDSRDARNSALVVAWLEATFPELGSPHMKGENVTVSRAHPYAPLDASLALQGPLISASQGVKKDGTYVSSSDCEGKAIDFLYNLIGKDSVFVIAWSSGLLQIDSLADEIQPLWEAGSSPHVLFDTSGNILGVSMICQSYSEDASAKHSQPLDRVLNTTDAPSAVSCRHLPPLLKLATVDLSLPKYALNGCQLSLFPDPLVSDRFYCLHCGGMDMIILHFLPFSNMNPQMDMATPPSVHTILTTSLAESSPPVFCGSLMVTDSYGHSQFVGVTPMYECLVLEVKCWNEMLPFHFDLDVKPAGSSETLIPEIISKELLNGPKAIVIPPSTSLRSLTLDSIEGRSTLHHYIKLFHENYVEYAHKVYIELEHHGEYAKTIIDKQLKRFKEVEQTLAKAENNEKGIECRIDRAFKVYELLEQRLANFKALPAANKRPLSKAEGEFKAELDRIADMELDGLHSAIEALNTRLKRYIQASPASSSNMARQAPGRRKNYVSNGQALQLKSTLGLLSSINSENTKKVKIIQDELSSLQK